MELTYGQLEATLASHFRIHPDRIGTFRSRIKQLQRLSFPPGVNIGRGAKMEYTGEHLFMLVTAFELIQSGLPAQAACHTVIDHWSSLSAGFALSAIQERGIFKNKAPQILAVLSFHSMFEIQIRKGWSEPRLSDIRICDEISVLRAIKGNKYSDPSTHVTIAMSYILNRVIDVAKERGGIQTSIFDEEFHKWLPIGVASEINFECRYPDRSNLKMRQELHRRYGNDPDSMTPEGLEEANDFLANDYSTGSPF